MWTLTICVVLLAAAAGFLVFRATQFDATINALRDTMLASQSGDSSARGELPDLVRRYALRAGGRVGGPTALHAQHRATLASAPDQAPMTITADQWTGTRIPGLIWKAHGAMMMLPVTVVDSYVGGNGMLSARVLGSFQVAGGAGPAFDKGELMRYLSELPIYPDAILNTSGLVWRQIDDLTVSVTAGRPGTDATVRFRFDTGGDIIALEADDRPMAVGDRTVPTAWHGLYSQYQQFSAYRLPRYGEVGWVLPGGLFTYWKGELVGYEPLPGIPGDPGVDTRTIADRVAT